MPRPKSTTATAFELKATILSGQVFRFDEAGDTFFLRAGDKVIRISQKDDKLFYEGCDRRFLRDYLQLDIDLESIHQELSKDKALRTAIREFPGLRVIRQDPWECLASFICSMVSNIPRIRKNIESLCQLYGRHIQLNGFESHSFPEPGALKSEQKMRDAGVGFRAKYLTAMNQKMNRENLLALMESSYEEARDALTEMPGVGAKVADCVLLFSLDFSEAFPVDVWIKRIVQNEYFQGRTVKDDDIRAFAADRFGPNAGYAQQYLFHYARMRSRSNG